MHTKPIDEKSEALIFFIHLYIYFIYLLWRDQNIIIYGILLNVSLTKENYMLRIGLLIVIYVKIQNEKS